MEKIRYMLDSEFDYIYLDERFRNATAFAHPYRDNVSPDKLILTHPWDWQTRFFITEDQKREALELLQKTKLETLEKHKNDLLFCCMGSYYPTRYEDDPCNCRIRTTFKNKDGRKFLLEVQDGCDFMAHVPHAIDLDLRDKMHKIALMAINERDKLRLDKDPSIYRIRELTQIIKDNTNERGNYNGVERLKFKYTTKNILDIVNLHFECEFKNIIVDHYNIQPKDAETICESPRQNKETKQLQIFL